MFSEIIDSQGNRALVGKNWELRAAKIVRLLWSWFVATTLDTNYWTTTLVNWGTVTLWQTIANVTTNTTSWWSATLETVKPALFNAITSNRFHGHFLCDFGILWNNREIGVGDASNGLFFAFKNTSFGIIIRKAGTDRFIPYDKFNKFVLTIDNKFHALDIEYSNFEIDFFIDDKLVHKETITTTSLIASLQLKIRIKNTNNTGVITNVNIQATGVSVYRIGEIESAPVYLNIVWAGTNTLKLNAGILRAIMINSGAWTSATVYDSITWAWITITTLITAAAATWLPDWWIFFNNWLTIVTVGAVNITVIWE